MEDHSGYEPLSDSRQVALPGAQAIGGADPQRNIEVTLKLRGKRPLPHLSVPPSKPMTREQLADEYGASPEDIDAVIRTYTQLGLMNAYTDAATRTVKFSGSVGEMEEAFQVRLFDYTHPDGNYRGYEGVVYIPGQLSGIVVGVFGLDDRRVAHRR